MRVKQLGFQFNTRSPAKSIVIDSMWVARESSSPMSRHVRHRHRGDVRDVQLAAAGDVAHLPRLHARKRHPVPYRPDAGHPSILAQVFRALALFLLVATWVYYGAWADGLMTPLAIRRFGRCDRRMTVGRGYSLHCFHPGRGRVPAYEQKFEDLSVRRETK